MNNPKQQEKIHNFIRQFTPTVTNSIYKALGRDVYKHIEIKIDSHHSIEKELEEYKELSFYSRNYNKEGSTYAFTLMLPNELIFKIADVFMGGTGNVEIKDTLSELETNAILKLLDNILKAIVPLYERICDTKIAFLSENLFSQKADEKHLEQLKTINLNYSIDFSLIFNESSEYKLHLLIDADDFKKTLTEMGLLKDEPIIEKNEITKMDIDLLRDIEIPLTAELGQSKIPMKYALELTEGSMIELDNNADDDIKIYSNGVEIGTAEIIVVGENFGIRIKQLMSPEERIRQIK